MSGEKHVQIQVRLLELPDELFKLNSIIQSFDWQKEGEERAGCTARVETLAKMAGKRVRQTQVNLARLEACGAISVERRPMRTNRLLCTPENFDPVKVQPTAPGAADRTTRRGQHPKVQPTAPQGAVEQQKGVQPTAPELETENQTQGSRDREPDPPAPPTTPATPSAQSRAGQRTEDGAYAVLDALQQAAGPVLLLDIVPQHPPPAPGLSGRLPQGLENRWLGLLASYKAEHQIAGPKLLARVKRAGEYLRAGCLAWAYRGAPGLSLHSLCDQRKGLFPRLLSEAMAWDGVAPAPVHERSLPRPEGTRNRPSWKDPEDKEPRN